MMPDWKSLICLFKFGLVYGAKWVYATKRQLFYEVVGWEMSDNRHVRRRQKSYTIFVFGNEQQICNFVSSVPINQRTG